MTALTKTKPWNRKQLADFKRAVLSCLWGETYFQGDLSWIRLEEWHARWQEMVDNGEAKDINEAEDMTDDEYEKEREWQAENWVCDWNREASLEVITDNIKSARKHWVGRDRSEITEYQKEEGLEEWAIAMQSTVWRDYRAFQKLFDVVCFIQEKFTPDDIFSSYDGLRDKVFDEYKHLLADVLEVKS